MNLATPTRILLVDDDPGIVAILMAMIRRTLPDGLRIKGISDPAEARRYLESEVVDLLITDLEMPGISGLDLLRCAKRRNAWTQMVVATGHSSLDALTTAMDLGAGDYLLKPINAEDVQEVISAILSRLTRWRSALAGTLQPA